MTVIPFPAAPKRPAAPASAPAYAELQVTTNFSFLRGASHPHELVAQAVALGHSAIAIADRNSVAGLVRAHLAAAELGLRLVPGARLDFRDGSPSVLCFPADRAAYGRLSRLLSEGKRRAPKGECFLDYADLLAFGEGQIVLAVPPGQPDDAFATALARLAADFPGRTYLAASHLYRGDDARRLARLAAMAERTSAPMVATNDILYHAPERRRLQDVMTCIREGCTIDQAGLKLEPNGERHLKPPAEMARLFRDYPDALAHTREIAERCRFSLKELTAAYEYPDEIAPDGEAPQARLARLTEEGLAWRYPAGVPDKVSRQVEAELALIAERNYAPFFLTVEDVVREARRLEILHQGRGSAANSAVCYALGITNVNPATADLLFARFISTARDEPPDIDVDFEHERREEIIQYIYRRFGRHRAGLVSTVISYRARGALREVGKALGLSDDIVGGLVGLIWGWSMQKPSAADIRAGGLDPEDGRLALTLELAGTLMGFPRHLSQHPGGFVIARGRLDELAPVENAVMADRTVIPWDKDDIDALGILKVDVLALGMLTCIRKARDLVKTHHGITLPMDMKPNDSAVYEMLGRADSVGVFQVESRAQQSMLPRLQPKNFYDLVIEVAIVRPGPIQGDMVHPYLRRRDGLEKPDLPSEELRAVLGKTLGVPLFQEQCMRVAMVAAEFSEAEADQLRRAMATFKKAGDIARFEERFIGRMVERGYALDFATRCFSQIKGFGTYGFPESHAAAFAHLVYVSAYIKCHYPAEFCVAILNSQPMGFYAPAQLVRDARTHGVEVRPIDVERSEWDHGLEVVPRHARPWAGHPRVCGAAGQVVDGRDKPGHDGAGEGPVAVRLGFRLVAGLSEKDGEAIVRNRGVGYGSVAAFARRSGLGPAKLRLLAEADAFAGYGLDRREALWALGGLDHETLPLFAAATAADREGRDGAEALPALPASQSVAEDYAATGLSLKRHPMSFLREALAARRFVTTADLRRLRDGTSVSMAGIVLFRQQPGTAKGTIFMTIEDETGSVNLIVWPKIVARHRRAVYGARLLAVTGRMQKEKGVIHLVSERLDDWSAALHRLQQGETDFPLGPGSIDPPGPGAGSPLRLKSRDFR
jgi:error-prone DNA polymerase